MTDAPARTLLDATHRLEEDERLDALADAGGRLAGPLLRSPFAPFLRGESIGHAMHPLLTDFPLGCWAAAGLLDLFGGRRSRRAAQRLVGLGLIAVPPTLASGAIDWAASDDVRAKRVGIVHAVGNLAVGTLYWRSWRARRRGNHVRGMLWGFAGGTLAWGTGDLGGHLSLVREVGDGERLPAGEAREVDLRPGRVDRTRAACSTSRRTAPTCWSRRASSRRGRTGPSTRPRSAPPACSEADGRLNMRRSRARWARRQRIPGRRVGSGDERFDTLTV